MRAFACLLFIALSITGCGRKGPLIYPDLLVPAAPSNVSVQQSGNFMKLSFVIPSKDMAGRTITGLSGITVVKRDEPSGLGPVCNSCPSDFLPFRTINLDLLTPDTQRYGRLLVLQDGAVQKGRTYTYRVSAVSKDNQQGAVSAPVAADMLASPGPAVLRVVNHPTEIQLEFEGLPPAEGIIAGYNIYRALKGESFPLLPLNRDPLTGNRYMDAGLERGVTYSYGVRTVVRLPAGGRLEGDLSNEAEGRLKDDE
jgi:predicted small lipoprotein YifL